MVWSHSVLQIGGFAFYIFIKVPHIINLNFLLQNFRQPPSKLYHEIWHLANNKTLT